ncbi:MAG: hypothetical protein J5725_04715 [Bacteroidales bacterium]|nr:hypothetical protein [Bacteroidales bacterium]
MEPRNNSSTTFTPPISDRETEELILIANNTTNAWQEDAIRQAKEELKKRDISNDEQNRVLQQSETYQKELEEDALNNTYISYSTGKMLLIFIGAPLLLLNSIYSFYEQKSLFVLRNEGYKLMFRQRLFLILGGILFWCIIFIIICKIIR